MSDRLNIPTIRMGYPSELTDPMRQELVRLGVQELRTPDEVDSALAQPGVTLVFVNSVCGCAAGSARPGLALALQHADGRPDRVTTVFAGVDREATERARQHLGDVPSSSPSAALLKDGRVVWNLHRYEIEGRSPEMVAESFVRAFEEHCS